MPAYMYRVGYTSDSWAEQIKKPTDRQKSLTPIVRGLGGRILSFYYAFGKDDVILIAQMPDNKAAAGLAIAAAAGGAVSHITTTPLMTVAEAMGAMRQGKRARYTPPA
ncbi:MAG: GYD domain-containing protein [Dehalococcoidia bacterium]